MNMYISRLSLLDKIIIGFSFKERPMLDLITIVSCAVILLNNRSVAFLCLLSYRETVSIDT